MDATLVWKVRRKHILIWGMVIAAVIAAGCYFFRQELAKANKGEVVLFCLMMEAALIWVLAPISITKARNGSRVSNIARGRLSFRGWEIDDAGLQRDERYYDSAYNSEEVQSMLFIVSILKFVVLIFPYLFFFALNRIKNIGCYLIVTLGFPVSTFIYYLKSRKKLNVFHVVVPLLVVFVLVPGCLTVVEVQRAKEEEAQMAVRQQEYEEALAEAQSIDYDLSFGKDMDLQEGEIRLVTVEENNLIYYSATGSGFLAEVPEGEILIGTGKTYDGRTKKIIYYQVYLTEDRTRTGWILYRNVEEMEE